MDNPTTIYSFITSEENQYPIPVQVVDDWEWNMKDHIETTILYKNSTYKTGKDDNKPFKNIIRPILNLQYRSEGFDVKDIELFVNEPKNYYKSFLIKKFHEKWARENEIDTFIDELVESYIDFGGALVKNVNSERPEVVPLQSIAFCDQTDILSGAFGIKHFFSADQLKEMEERGWGDKANGANMTIDELILLAEKWKVKDRETGEKTSTPSKYIEVYEVHGSMPDKFLDEDADDNKYSSQMHIVCFYQNEKNQKEGVTLFKGKEPELPFKLVLRDKIYGRALGLGGAEELFEPQVWINYDEIRKKDMLDAAAKIVLKTTDPTIAAKHPTGLKDLDNLEIVEIQEGSDIGQLDTFPRNLQLFEQSTQQWEEHAQQMGAAGEAIMGESPKSGTPFRLQALVAAEAHSLHEYRKGKLATFIDEIYKDWIIPRITEEIIKGKTFLSELELDEMQEIGDRISKNAKNKRIIEDVLNGKLPNIEELEAFEQLTKDEFRTSGNKKFIEILKDEMKKAPVDVRVNIKGKQKNMSLVVDKLSNIFRTIISAPQILENPAMAKLFNQIIENSGLNPIDFAGFKMPALPPQGRPEPLNIPQEKGEPIPTPSLNIS